MALDAQQPDGGEPLRIETERGPISCLYHRGQADAGALIMVGGTDGGFQGPADAIYPALAHDLLEHGIGSLRLDFRIHVAPGPVEEGAYDVLAGVSFLKGQGVSKIGLIGHSYGGAVVIAAGALSPAVSAVVTLSTQSAGATLAPQLAPRPLLLIHGAEDRRLPPDCSRYVYRLAREPKQLLILPGARHSLRQRREELRGLLVEWLHRALTPTTRPEGQA
ncbi:MAG: alpha/beta hydrolase [Dehalococcoidia bacterium]